MPNMAITLWIIGAIVLFLVIDFIAMPAGKGLNDFIDRWLLRTLWLWLPFFAFKVLMKELFVRMQSKK